jgi:hypothetical protein
VVRARAEPRGRETHEREDYEGRKRQPPVEKEHEDHRAAEHEGVLDEARHAVGDEQVERLDVVRYPADDRAGAIPLVVPEGESLEVLEELDPEVGEAALSDPASEVRLGRGQPEHGDGSQEERDDDERDRPQGALVDAVVDRRPGEEWREQRDCRESDERADREERSKAIRAREPDEHPHALPRLPPRPVFDPRTALVAQVAPELPDLHPATTCWRTPCSWISRKTGSSRATPPACPAPRRDRGR